MYTIALPECPRRARHSKRRRSPRTPTALRHLDLHLEVAGVQLVHVREHARHRLDPRLLRVDLHVVRVTHLNKLGVYIHEVRAAHGREDVVHRLDVDPSRHDLPEHRVLLVIHRGRHLALDRIRLVEHGGKKALRLKVVNLRERDEDKRSGNPRKEGERGGLEDRVRPERGLHEGVGDDVPGGMNDIWLGERVELSAVKTNCVGRVREKMSAVKTLLAKG